MHKPIKFEDSFILLKVHIKLFELLEEKDREKILLIDFPGLNVLKNKNYFNSDVLGPLINQSDSFLFINPELVNSDENQIIINNIIKKIQIRKISFSYNNCLFIMNKWDRHKNDGYSLDDAKNDLKSIFSNNDLDNIFPDIDIINFSCSDYNAFLNVEKQILIFDNYFKGLLKEFENDYEENSEDYEEDENKNESFYKYIKKGMSKIREKLIGIPNDINYENKNKKEIINKLNNILAQTEYKLPDNYKNEIAKTYLDIKNNINKHEFLIDSNKNKLEQNIISHLKSSILIMQNIIKAKGINFLIHINDTISFILEKLDSKLKTTLNYEKVQQNENLKKEINDKFKKLKDLIFEAIEKNKAEQESMIDKYIREVNDLFVNRKRENMNLENKKILGQIERETLDKLKENKNIFYQSLEKKFKTFIEEIQEKISVIKFNLDIKKENFNQAYFETSEVGSDVVDKSLKSNFFGVIKSITDFLNIKSWSEYILHKYILLDDQNTIINKSIENFKLVKIQNQENLDDYRRVYQEKIEDFQTLVDANIQKMIDLSVSDYNKFKGEKREIIEKSIKEFNAYIEKKYKDN